MAQLSTAVFIRTKVQNAMNCGDSKSEREAEREGGRKRETGKKEGKVGEGVRELFVTLTCSYSTSPLLAVLLDEEFEKQKIKQLAKPGICPNFL